MGVGRETDSRAYVWEQILDVYKNIHTHTLLEICNKKNTMLPPPSKPIGECSSVMKTSGEEIQVKMGLSATDPMKNKQIRQFKVRTFRCP